MESWRGGLEQQVKQLLMRHGLSEEAPAPGELRQLTTPLVLSTYIGGGPQSQSPSTFSRRQPPLDHQQLRPQLLHKEAWLADHGHAYTAGWYRMYWRLAETAHEHCIQAVPQAHNQPRPPAA